MENNEDFEIKQEIENINNAFSQANSKEQKTSIFKKWWFWVIISVLATALIVGVTGNSDDNSNSGGSQSGGSNTQGISWKTSGTYKVGVDIDAGEYFIKCTSYNCYVQVSSDSTGSFNSIIANDNISTHAYITVRDGEYLTITGGKFVLSSKVGAIEPSSDGTYGEGMYKAGKDISAGEYFIKCTSYNCYVQVSSDSVGTLNSIIANDNISTHTYITVREGEYLTVNGGNFVLSSKVGAVEPSSDGTYEEGMYKVGKDIPAGEYKIVAINSCYIEVSDSSNHTLHSIISNDNIDVGTSTYITVSNGQYLKVIGGKIYTQ